MGDKGLERTRFRSDKTAIADSVCAESCADSEIPPFVIEAGRIADWADLSPRLREAIVTLDPEVLAALQMLFHDRAHS